MASNGSLPPTEYTPIRKIIGSTYSMLVVSFLLYHQRGRQRGYPPELQVYGHRDATART